MSDFDVFLADCPARTTLGVIGDTWSVVVVVALGERPRRFSELQERIGGISNKVLADVLRRLTGSGVLERRDLPTAPPGVEYRLSPLGNSLLEPVTALCRWAEERTDALLEALGHRPVTHGSASWPAWTTPSGSVSSARGR